VKVKIGKIKLAAQLSILGVKIIEALFTDIGMPSPKISNGLGNINCRMPQNKTVRILYIYYLDIINSCFTELQYEL
jgi:hypothetical protein